MTKMNSLNLGIQDLKKSIAQYRVWMHLGWVEVKQRYRRSIIGPWWISLSMLIFIMMMGLVFSRLFHQSLNEYIPFFTAGFLFWSFISTSIIEAAEIFKSNGGFIKQTSLPYNIYVLKHIVRQVICLFHNFVVYLLICFYFKINPGMIFFGVIPGLLLLFTNLYWICFLVAIICARYRDMVPMLSTCMQIAFFVTPISWMPKLLEQHAFILKLNPFVYFLDIVRSPLLGIMPSLTSIIVSTGMALIGNSLCFWIFSWIRPRIAYWVD